MTEESVKREIEVIRSKANHVLLAGCATVSGGLGRHPLALRSGSLVKLGNSFDPISDSFQHKDGE